MALYVVGLFFATLTVLATVYPKPYLSKTLFLLYCLTSFVLAFIRESTINVVFMLRYFFYIMTGFIMSFVPLLLLLMSVLIIIKMKQQAHISLFRKCINIFIVVNLLLLAFITVWGAINFDVLHLNILIDIYNLVSMYFVVSFIMFILINAVIHYLPIQKPTKTIIVLGYTLNRQGQMSKSLLKRLDRAIALYFKQLRQFRQESTIIVTGGKDVNSQVPEADVMRDYLIEHRIPKDRVIAEEYATNTDQNLQLSYKLIQKQQLLAPILIITSRFHLMRTMFLTDRLGIKADFLGSVSAWTIWPYHIVREYVAYLTLIKEWNYIYLFILVMIELVKII